MGEGALTHSNGQHRDWRISCYQSELRMPWRFLQSDVGTPRLQSDVGTSRRQSEVGTPASRFQSEVGTPASRFQSDDTTPASARFNSGSSSPWTGSARVDDNGEDDVRAQVRRRRWLRAAEQRQR